MAVETGGAGPAGEEVRTLNRFGVLLLRAGKAERAVLALEKAAAVPGVAPDARILHNLGIAYEEGGRREAALRAWRRAVRADPEQVDSAACAGAVAIKLGHPALALALSEMALAVDPGSRDGACNAATALRQLGRQAEAVERAWQAVERASGKPRPPPLCTAAEEGCGPASRVCVVCIKWGTKYGPEYVNRLAASLRRHAAVPALEVVCYTDDAAGLTAGVEARPLPSGMPGWWNKALLFSLSAAEADTRFVFVDLDTVVVGDVTPLLRYDGPFAVLGTDSMANEGRSGGFNSSLMLWRGGWGCPISTELLARRAAVLGAVHRFDHWLEMVVPGAARLEDSLPGMVGEYASDCAGGRAPPGERGLVTFPLHPKPHHVAASEGWIQRHWRE